MAEQKEIIKQNDDLFLDHFRELETYVVSHCNLNDDFISFSRALTNIYNHGLNPIISNKEHYEFLKSASDLRNIISHRNDVCFPTDEFIKKFVTLKDAIVNSKHCIDIAIKNIIGIERGYSIKQSLEILDENKLSHLPIMQNKKVIGVFSRTTLFEIFSKNIKTKLDETYIVSDFLEYCLLDKHSTEYYLFVAKNTSVNDVFKLLRKNSKHDKRLALVFVTENGKQNENILGLITETDLVKNII